MTGAVTVRAPGKVNLALAVGPRREDGYHPLATVFQAVSVFEEVTARPADALGLTVSGVTGAPVDATNLAGRAAPRRAGRAGGEPQVHLHVHKQVPVAGGMAGGSADAAAALLACDVLWGTGQSREDLATLAAELGADVPFCLLGGTAVGSGRGDLLSPVLTRGRYHWTLAVRRTGLSTPTVFARFDELAEPGLADPEPDRELLAALRTGEAEELGRCLGNDLEPAALELAPELERTIAVARGAGALGVLVSGSGPTVAALARSRRHAAAIGAALTAAGAADDVLTVTGPVPGARVV
jgi:4-diphosphocytidyl-2-C-methyl-D-erythritol kinase